MGKKGNKGNAAATVQAPTVVTGAGTPKAKTAPGVLAVKAGASLRGARAAWYAVLQAHDGKPVAEFLAATKENPPSVPKSGNAENPTGWLRWFQRNGWAEVKAEA